MASYAALVSLNTIIATIQNHPNPPISIDNQQAQALVQKVSFLQEFLELYSHRENCLMDGLESHIRDVAYAAEDLIESYIVDHIEGSISGAEDSNRGQLFYQDLQEIIEDMDIIKIQATGIREKLGEDKNHQHLSLVSNASSVSPPSLGQKNIMVGFDDVLEDVLHKLTRQPQSSFQILPIVGMGGIGKTTLALNVYKHPHVDHYFDIYVWATISQKYSTEEVLAEILCQSKQESKDNLSCKSKEEIGEMIYKKFSGWRYLVVLDDMWSTEVWDEINLFFPNKNNGSRMIITTRLSNVAAKLTCSSCIQMDFLDENKSWNLFQKVVFKEDGCSLELEEIGKKIARNCKGLPLSIVVIGGVLAKSERTKQHWELVCSNLGSIVNLEDDQHCLKILHMSYKQLPIHLKSCFLYMGIYSEDERVNVSYLVKLLVAEGFLKPIGGKIMEEVAKEYIKDLVDRNLLLVDTWG